MRTLEDNVKVVLCDLVAKGAHGNRPTTNSSMRSKSMQTISIPVAKSWRISSRKRGKRNAISIFDWRRFKLHMNGRCFAYIQPVS